MCFHLKTSVHEPGHLEDVNQVQDIRIVMLHALTKVISIQIYEIKTKNIYIFLKITSVFQLIMSMSMFFIPAPLQSNTQEI